MYKVFVNDKPICLVDANHKFDLVDGDFVLGYQNIHDMQLTLDIFEKEKNVNRLYIVHSDIEQLLKEFINCFDRIEAAGGLVYNANGDLLFIKRYDKWDLPKGKIESNETIEVAAIREVEEECSVTNLKIVNPIKDTYHIYHDNNKRILKITHWFKMNTTATNGLKPQTSEGITEAKWVAIADLKEILSNTYGNIKDLLKEV